MEVCLNLRMLLHGRSEQNEDVKFKINRCKFTENTEGTVTLVNDVVPVKTLKQNPITTTSWFSSNNYTS